MGTADRPRRRRRSDVADVAAALTAYRGAYRGAADSGAAALLLEDAGRAAFVPHAAALADAADAAIAAGERLADALLSVPPAAAVAGIVGAVGADRAVLEALGAFARMVAEDADADADRAALAAAVGRVVADADARADDDDDGAPLEAGG